MIVEHRCSDYVIGIYAERGEMFHAAMDEQNGSVVSLFQHTADGLDHIEEAEMMSVRVAALAGCMKDSVKHQSLKADLMAHMWVGKEAQEQGEIDVDSTETT